MYRSNKRLNFSLETWSYILGSHGYEDLLVLSKQLHSSCYSESSLPLKLSSPYPLVLIPAWIHSLESGAVKKALAEWLGLESRVSMRQETTASSLPSALHNFWTSQTVLVKIKWRWRLQTYWTLLFCESWQWNWRPVWVSQWGAGSCESLFQEAAAVWHGLLFTGLNMQSTWKDLGELEERQWKWVRGLAAKTQENLLAMWAEAPDFHHGMFLLTAGGCSVQPHRHIYVPSSTAGPERLLWPCLWQKRLWSWYFAVWFMTRHVFCSCFWLSACILSHRPLCKLGEWLVLVSVHNYTRRKIRVDSYDLVFRQLPCNNKEERWQGGRHSPNSGTSKLFSIGQFIYVFWSLFGGPIFLKGVEFAFYSWSLLFGEAGAGYLQSNRHKFKDSIRKSVKKWPCDSLMTHE